MCECTAHLFFSRSVGGHTQRAPPGANLLPALLTPPSRSGTARGHSCHAARDIHTSTDCHQPLLSSPASVGIKTHKCLPGHLFRGRTDAVLLRAGKWGLEKRGTFCRSTYTGCKCFKIAHGFVWAQNSHAGKFSVKFLELHCVTIMQVKEEKSA